jgi:hypothetical protein
MLGEGWRLGWISNIPDPSPTPLLHITDKTQDRKYNNVNIPYLYTFNGQIGKSYSMYTILKQ